MAKQEQFGPAIDPQLAVERGLIGIDRWIGENEFARDLSEGPTLEQEIGDFSLAFREAMLSKESLKRWGVRHVIAPQIQQPLLLILAQKEGGDNGENEEGNAEENQRPISGVRREGKGEEQRNKQAGGIGKKRKEGPEIIESDVLVFFGIDPQNVIKRK
jgi:hypothetical protein